MLYKKFIKYTAAVNDYHSFALVLRSVFAHEHLDNLVRQYDSLLDCNVTGSR